MTVIQFPEHITEEAEVKRANRAWRKRLGESRYPEMVDQVIDLIVSEFLSGRLYTLFGLEGDIRAFIRSDLCLSGWKWDDADLMAFSILTDAFIALKAERPTYQEGQPEWTDPIGGLIERTRCVRCHSPLPEENYKYCSSMCRNRHVSQVIRDRVKWDVLAVSLAPAPAQIEMK